MILPWSVLCHVNNETGAIQPLRSAGDIIKSVAPQAIFHIDAVQSFGRLPLDFAGWKADAASMSGHKIHAPNGVCLLWLRKGVNIPALSLEVDKNTASVLVARI